MPEIIYNADQGAGVRKIIRIMQGDTRSHVVRFVVPRYESGVDLAPLVWYIKLVDADGVPDVALPSALYEVTESEIRVRWTVNGVSTDVVGSTKFQLYGAAEDADGHVISWTSGAGEIEVTQNIGFATTEEQEDGMNTLDTLITFVQGELNAVIAAGNSAAAAATSANNAASSANNAASSANAEASAANSAASAANNAAAAANSAAASANAAASIADSKANALTTAFDANPAVIYPDANSILKPVSVLSPVQAGEGDPSPENIRPISGWTGAELTRCGKNLIPFTNTTKTSNGVTFTPQADGRIHIEGTATTDAIYVIYGEWQGKSGISIPKGTNVKATTNLNGVFALIYGYMSDGSYKGVYSLYNTLPETITDTYVYLQVNSGVAVDGYFTPALTIDGWSTEYEPYQGDAYTLDFGQTVYGGKVDWNKGEMVVNTGFAAFDGSENWVVFTYVDGRQSFYTSGSNALPGIMSGTYIYVPGICSWSPSVDGYITDILRTDVDSVAIEIKPDVLSKWGIGDLDTFKARLAANPMQIAYKLANPITIQLTPQLISALSGLNTVYGDGGALEGSYNKSLSAAFEEIRNAILSMGGNV